MVAQALSRVQTIVNSEGISSSEAFRQALNQAEPRIFLNSSSTSSNQGVSSLLVLLAIGLACAMGFSFLGGLIGLRNEGRRRI